MYIPTKKKGELVAAKSSRFAKITKYNKGNQSVVQYHSLCRVATCGSTNEYKIQAVSSPDSSMSTVHKHSQAQNIIFQVFVQFQSLHTVITVCRDWNYMLVSKYSGYPFFCDIVC